MVATAGSTAEIWDWLSAIADPEIPVLSILDLGIVRDVSWAETGELIIAVTPTYSGCPALDMISQEIRRGVERHGIEKLRLETRLYPPWTTDWMPEAAKERLREYGISPPPKLIPAEAIASVKPCCPRCHSADTELISRYGSTPCKALYKCRTCLEPFDVFKRH